MEVDRNDSGAETLASLFDEAQSLYNEIDTTSLSSNSDELQVLVEKCREQLEQVTILVSHAGVFSSNEDVEELSDTAIGLLLLPALLAAITLKRRCVLPSQHQQKPQQNGAMTTKEIPKREYLLKLAKIYFRDFITRCQQYGITSVELPDEDDEDAAVAEEAAKRDKAAPARRGMPTQQELAVMGREREEKVRRFRERRTLEQRLAKLREAKVSGAAVNDIEVTAKGEGHDERELHTTAVNLAILTSLEELGSIKEEMKMLAHAETLRHGTVQQQEEPPEKRKPLQAFLLRSRGSVQQEVFGAGYPSLPTMSVDEFYEEQVREGKLPAPGSGGVVVKHDGSWINNPPPEEDPDQEEGVDSGEDDSEEKRERRVAKDEYRDVHRRGWGNTYNRS